MAARARSAPLGRSRWPLEPARLRWGARNGRSNSLGSARALEIARPGWSKTPHLPTFPSSSTLGSSGALDMAARARSAPLGRSKWPLELARLRQGARNCSAWLLENIAPADVSEFEPARLRWGARHWRSSPLGSAGPETLHWAGPRMPVALNTETNILCAWYARVRSECSTGASRASPNRRMRDGCRSSLPRSRSYLEMAARACP